MGWQAVKVILLSYVLGAIPFGYIAGRLKGIDITKLGSGNIGATNAFRILGPVPGLLVLLADGAKGYLAAYLAMRLVGTEAMAITAGGIAILAHSYSVFLRFKGGRGVACAAGVLLYLMPVVIAVAISIWIGVIALTKYVSLGSIIAAAAVPPLIWLTGNSLTYLVFGLLAATFVIIKHIPNIKRLLAGTELKINARVR